MKDREHSKYFYAAISLFCVIALSLLLFFILLRFDGIANIINKIIKALMPFIVGAVLAYIIAPMCDKFEFLYNKLFKKMKDLEKKEKVCRGLGVFSGLIITIIMIYISIIVIVPQLINSLIKIVQILPDRTDSLIKWVQSLVSSNEDYLKFSHDIIDKGYRFIDNWLSNDLIDSFQNIATGVSTGVINIVAVLLNIFIGFIVAIYLLYSRNKFKSQLKLIIYSIFKKNLANKIINEIKYADKVFSGFINGKIVDAIIISIICYIGMMIYHLFDDGPYMSEVLVAVIVGIFNLIPFFGWYMALIISAILILMINPAQCIFFIIFDIILQQIDGNVLGPKIIGDTTGISSFWVLFSILLFGGLWGFAGMIIGVPLFAVIYHAIENLVFRGLKKRGQSEMIIEYRQEYPDKDIVIDKKK